MSAFDLPEDDLCVICGSSEQSAQGGLCPRHTYDEGPQTVTPTDPIAEALTAIPVTGLRHTKTDTYLTPTSARKLAAHLREQGLTASNTLENKTKEEQP